MNLIYRMNLCIFLTLFSGSVLAEGIMVPGGWELTMTVFTKNPSTGEKKLMSDSIASECLSKEFLASEPDLYLKPSTNKEKFKSKGVECYIEGYERNGSNAQWTMKCKSIDGTSMVAKFLVSLSAKKALVKMNQVVTQGDQSVYFDSVVQHKHIGECTNNMPRRE